MELPGPRLYIPDIMVFERGSADADLLRSPMPPPLLVAEVSSLSTRDLDRGIKADDYGEGGAQWYWIVDLARRVVIVHRNVVAQPDSARLVEVQRIVEPAPTAGPFRLVRGHRRPGGALSTTAWAPPPVPQPCRTAYTYGLWSSCPSPTSARQHLGRGSRPRCRRPSTSSRVRGRWPTFVKPKPRRLGASASPARKWPTQT